MSGRWQARQSLSSGLRLIRPESEEPARLRIVLSASFQHDAKDKKAKRRTLQASSLAVLDGLLFVVHPNGLEPLTDRLEGGCSIQLS